MSLLHFPNGTVIQRVTAHSVITSLRVSIVRKMSAFIFDVSKLDVELVAILDDCSVVRFGRFVLGAFVAVSYERFRILI